MSLAIVKYGDRILREKAVPVAAVTPELRELALAMIDTMHEASGVGLAAEQVGRLERLFVIDVPPDCIEDPQERLFNAPIPMPLVCFNPVIVAREGSQCDKEGCLSFPGLGGKVTRAREVTVSFVDLAGRTQTVTARGLLARAFQHEYDHLEGVLYVDHLSAVEKMGMTGKLKKLARANGGVR